MLQTLQEKPSTQNQSTTDRFLEDGPAMCKCVNFLSLNGFILNIPYALIVIFLNDFEHFFLYRYYSNDKQTLILIKFSVDATDPIVAAFSEKFISV